MDSYDVLFASKGFPRAVELLGDRLGSSYKVSFPDSSEPLSEQVEAVDFIIPSMAEINSEVIEAADNLKGIVQFGVGLEGVDRETAAKKGIPVDNVEGANSVSVAECSLHLMLALARKFNRTCQTFGRGEIGHPVGNELRNKNLLIVGLGSSGAKLAQISAGLQMNCKAIRKNPGKGAPGFVQEIGGPERLLSFLPWADFVCLHLPLTDETEALFGTEEFQAMRSPAYLVNVSRGPIIEKTPLHRALKEEKLAGAGLDVYWTEPPNPEDPLYQLPNVITTPHIAGVTEECYQRLAKRVADLIEGYSK